MSTDSRALCRLAGIMSWRVPKAATISFPMVPVAPMRRMRMGEDASKVYWVQCSCQLGSKLHHHGKGLNGDLSPTGQMCTRQVWRLLSAKAYFSRLASTAADRLSIH